MAGVRRQIGDDHIGEARRQQGDAIEISSTGDQHPVGGSESAIGDFPPEDVEVKRIRLLGRWIWRGRCHLECEWMKREMKRRWTGEGSFRMFVGIFAELGFSAPGGHVSRRNGRCGRHDG
jgi:hypothetical protein